MIKITNENNFCRVFEMPDEFPSDFCFQGGYDTVFKMVDWFKPINIHINGKSELWEDNRESLIRFVNNKNYIKPDRKYILITDFGESIVFGNLQVIQ